MHFIIKFIYNMLVADGSMLAESVAAEKDHQLRVKQPRQVWFQHTRIFLLDHVAPTFFAFLTLHHLSLPPSGAFSLICSKMQAQSAVHVTMCNNIRLFFNIKNVNVSYRHKRIRFSVLYSFAPFILVGSLLLITEPRKNHSLLFFPHILIRLELNIVIAAI